MAFAIGFLHAVFFVVLVSNLVYLRRRGAVRAQGDTPGEAPFVSVLIPARNEEENLRRLLPLLLEQDYPDYEVIVYDDASDDGTWQVLDGFRSERLRPLRGDGPPPGWVGKVHALHQATRHARGTYYLFLDADARLSDAGALRRLVAHAAALPPDAVLTGLTRLRGGAQLIVSLVPWVILCQLPWALVRPVRHASLGALNGQCWMIDATVYHRHEPHAHVAGEILEDVEIGRYLKRCGLTPALVDVQREVSVYMYRTFATAWRGFRKNAYLIAGGRPVPFLAGLAVYVLACVLAPVFSLWLLGSLYVLKGVVDRRSGFPVWVTLLAPLAFALGALLQLDSAVSHWTNRVSWKGRRIETR